MVNLIYAIFFSFDILTFYLLHVNGAV